MSLMYYRTNRNKFRINTARTDIVEDENGYTITTELPGFVKSDILIDADFESLRITAEKNSEVSEDELKPTYLVRERYLGKTSRVISFPKPVSAKDAKVQFMNGLLTITIPFNETAKPVRLVPDSN